MLRRYSSTLKNQVVITDPYLIYKNLVMNEKIKKDPHQLALVKKLSLLSKQLQDYKPNLVDVKINKLIRDIEIKLSQDESWRNRLIGMIDKEKSKEQQCLKLIKVVNDYDELYNNREMEHIPKGLLINGDVGCGKSMMMDIFANSLPIKGKIRIHWLVFIELIIKEIEKISINKRDNNEQINHSILKYENEFLLFQIASNLISKYHVLIIDEFMLPDITSAKIVNHLFIYFFKLGGVLITSSNKLPKDLYSGSINKDSIENFEKILKARCELWNMTNDIDYRKIEDNEDDNWCVLRDDKKRWNELVSSVIDLNNCEANTCKFENYSREIRIPKCNENVAYFKFNDIIKDGKYGNCDFVSIASNFQIIIIDEIPNLTNNMKNQARKLISFIDAIYDCKCQLMINIESNIDEIFFNSKEINKNKTRFKCTPLEDSVTNEVQDYEMFTKTEMDLSNPYRPNFATYEDSNKDYHMSNETENVNNSEQSKNYTNLKKFTGDDEMFSYKRAVSRIYEMTHSKRWRENKWIPNDIKQL